MKHQFGSIAAALLLWSGATFADEPPAAASEYGQPAPGAEQVSDTQLEAFSTAMDEVQSVQQEYSQAIQQAENPEEAQTLQADAQEEMRSAVEDTGLTIADYNLIAQQLQSNPELVRRLQEIRSQ